MATLATWIFCVIAAFVVLFMAGAKTAEARRRNDELLDQLAALVNAIEQQPLELGDYIDDIVEQSRDVVISYDEHCITRDTLPR